MYDSDCRTARPGCRRRRDRSRDTPRIRRVSAVSSRRSSSSASKIDASWMQSVACAEASPSGSLRTAAVSAGRIVSRPSRSTPVHPGCKAPWAPPRSCTSARAAARCHANATHAPGESSLRRSSTVRSSWPRTTTYDRRPSRPVRMSENGPHTGRALARRTSISGPRYTSAGPSGPSAHQCSTAAEDAGRRAVRRYPA